VLGIGPQAMGCNKQQLTKDRLAVQDGMARL
jgi:hypothetical protein